MYYKGREYFGAVVTGRSLRGGRMRALGPLETSALLPGVEGGFVLFLVVSRSGRSAHPAGWLLCYA